MPQKTAIVPLDGIQRRVLQVRDQKVMIDADLADLYGVPTKVLNQAVRRNQSRFPGDFMFQLTEDEKVEVVTDCDHLKKLKYSHALPLAFTEHGALMAAAVLNTEQAIEVSVYVVRAFVEMREMLSNQQKLTKKFDELEEKLDRHDQQISSIIKVIRGMMSSPKKPKARIGFKGKTDT